MPIAPRCRAEHPETCNSPRCPKRRAESAAFFNTAPPTATKAKHKLTSPTKPITPQPTEADMVAIAEGHFDHRENPTAWTIVRERRENPRKNHRAGFLVVKNKATGTHFGVYCVKDLYLDEITYTNLTGEMQPINVDKQTWEKSGQTRTFAPNELADVEDQLAASLNGASRTPGTYAMESYDIWDTEDERDLINVRFRDTATGQQYTGQFEHHHAWDEVNFASYLPADLLQSITRTDITYQSADGTVTL